MSAAPLILSRRRVLAGSGALIVSFGSLPAALAQSAQQQNGGNRPANAAPELPGSLHISPFLDSWIRVEASGAITVFTGKAELGQGIKTALLQVAAEQLDANLDQLTLVTADTGRTPNEGFTAGSHSLQDSGTAIMNAAAQVRQILLAQAAQRAGAPAEQLKTENAVVVAPDGRRFGYGELVSGEILHVRAAPQSPLKDPQSFRVMNHSVRRVDIPAKVTGGAAYVQDMRPAGMVHGRVVRPPSPGAKLISVDSAAVEKMRGVLKVVRDGNFLAVIAEREFPAIEAMRALAAAARWQESAKLPDAAKLPTVLTGLPAQDITVLDNRQPSAGGGKSLDATYSRPYLVHGSIGPSCALAHLDNETMTVWTHTQGVYPDRDAIAEMLRMPKEQVRCIHAEGSGCTAIMAPTMPRPMRRCSRAHSRAVRCACNGCASRSTPGSRSAPPWWSR